MKSSAGVPPAKKPILRQEGRPPYIELRKTSKFLLRKIGGAGILNLFWGEQ